MDGCDQMSRLPFQATLWSITLPNLLPMTKRIIDLKLYLRNRGNLEPTTAGTGVIWNRLAKLRKWFSGTNLLWNRGSPDQTISGTGRVLWN